MLTTLIQLCQSVEFLLVSRKCNIARGKHSKRENSSPRASACCAITIGEKGGGGGGTKRRTKRTKRARECAFGQGDPDGLQQAPRRRRQLQLHLLRRKEGNSLTGTTRPKWRMQPHFFHGAYNSRNSHPIP